MWWNVTLSKKTLLCIVNNDNNNNYNNAVFFVLMWCSLVRSCQQVGRVYIVGIYRSFLQDLRRAVAMKLSKREWTLTVAICTLWNRHSSQTINTVNMIKQRVPAVYNKLGVTSDFCMCNIVIFLHCILCVLWYIPHPTVILHFNTNLLHINLC